MRKLVGHSGKVRALAFSPDGRRIASVAGRETRVSLWDVVGGERVLSPRPLAEGSPLAFAPDGARVTVASMDCLLHWDFASGAFGAKWLRATNVVRQVAYSPDGSLLVASCFGGYFANARFRVDAFRTGKSAKKTFLDADPGQPYGLTFSADGRFLATVCASARVRVWRMGPKPGAVSWPGPASPRAVALSPDGELVAVGAKKAVTLYPGTGRKPLGELRGHAGTIRALSFAPDGTLLSAGDDGTVRLWDVGTRRERICFDWQIGKVSAATFSPDGTLAAAGGEDGLVVWDIG